MFTSKHGGRRFDNLQDYLKEFVQKIRRHYKTYTALLIAVLLAAGFLMGVGILVRYDLQYFEEMPEIPIVYQNYRHRMDLTDINSLKIDWKHGDIKLLTADDTDQITIMEYSDKGLTSQKQLQLTTENQLLTISWSAEGFFQHLLSNDTKKLAVILPKSFADQLERFTCQNQQGNISIRGISAQVTTLKSHSGDIYHKNSRAAALFVTTTTGDIQLESLNCTGLKIQTTGGNVSGQAITAENAIVESTAGDVDLSGTLTNRMQLETISGAIRVLAEQYPADTSIESVRGDIDLYLPPAIRQEGFRLDYDTMYGRVDLDYPVVETQKHIGTVVYGNQLHAIKIKTTSGEITMQEMMLKDR